MFSKKIETVVMTEFNSSFFNYYFPVLLSHKNYRIRRIFFSKLSSPHLTPFLSKSFFTKIKEAAGMYRAGKKDRARCLLWLTFNTSKIDIYDKNSFVPVKCDYLCSLGFMKLIPESQIKASATSSNIHWSLLPAYAGLHPFYWVFRDRQERSGITIHRISTEYDAGDILIQRVIEIGPDDNAMTFRNKAARASVEEFDRYLSGKASYDASARPQDKTGRSVYGKPSPEDYEISPSDQADVIIAKVKAAAGEKCFVSVDGRKRRVKSAKLSQNGGHMTGETLEINGVTLLLFQ